MTIHESRTVFKLGGSLLLDPGWPTRLKHWMMNQPPGEYFGIVGGGLMIDALRDLDDLYGFSQVDLHWRCIRALDATYEIAAELLPEFDRIGSTDLVQAIVGSQPKIDAWRIGWVRIAAFYSHATLADVPLEVQPAIGWSTTSDSLALFLAHRIGARRCVLFKSCSVRHIASLEHAIVEEIIDPETIRFRPLVPSIELSKL